MRASGDVTDCNPAVNAQRPVAIGGPAVRTVRRQSALTIESAVTGLSPDERRDCRPPLRGKATSCAIESHHARGRSPRNASSLSPASRSRSRRITMAAGATAGFRSRASPRSRASSTSTRRSRRCGTPRSRSRSPRATRHARTSTRLRTAMTAELAKAEPDLAAVAAVADDAQAANTAFATDAQPMAHALRDVHTGPEGGRQGGARASASRGWRVPRKDDAAPRRLTRPTWGSTAGPSPRTFNGLGQAVAALTLKGLTRAAAAKAAAALSRVRPQEWGPCSNLALLPSDRSSWGRKRPAESGHSEHPVG